MPSTFTIFDPNAIDRVPATKVYGRSIPHGNIGNSGALEKVCMHFCENYMRENGTAEAVVVSRVLEAQLDRVTKKPIKEMRTFNLDNRAPGPDGGYAGAIALAESLFSGDWRLATKEEALEYHATNERNREIAAQTKADHAAMTAERNKNAILQSAVMAQENENIKLKLELARLEASNKATSTTPTKVEKKGS